MHYSKEKLFLVALVFFSCASNISAAPIIGLKHTTQFQSSNKQASDNDLNSSINQKKITKTKQYKKGHKDSTIKSNTVKNSNNSAIKNTKRIKFFHSKSPYNVDKEHKSIWGPMIMHDATYHLNLSDFALYNANYFAYEPKVYESQFSRIKLLHLHNPYFSALNSIIPYSEINFNKPLFISSGVVFNDNYSPAVPLLFRYTSPFYNYFWSVSFFIRETNLSDYVTYKRDPQSNNVSFPSFPMTFGYIMERDDTISITVTPVNSNYFIFRGINRVKKNENYAVEGEYGLHYMPINSMEAFTSLSLSTSGFYDYESGDWKLSERFGKDESTRLPSYNQTTFSLNLNLHGIPWYKLHSGSFAYNPKDHIGGFDILTSAAISFSIYKLPGFHEQFWAPKTTDGIYHYYDEWGDKVVSENQRPISLDDKLDQISATFSGMLEIRGVKKLDSTYALLDNFEGYNLDLGLKVSMGWLYTGLSRVDPYRKWDIPPTVLSVNLIRPDDFGRQALSFAYTYAEYKELNITSGVLMTDDTVGYLVTDGIENKRHLPFVYAYSFGISRSIIF